MSKYKKQDAADLEKKHLRLKEELSQSEDYRCDLKTSVDTAVQDVLYSKLLYILEDIPSEEINRDKLGIKVKNLEDAGYKNLADIEKATEKELSDVGGISSQGAIQIKSLLEEIKKRASAGLKIDLFAERSDSLKKLIAALYTYEQAMPYVDECFNLYTAYNSGIDGLLEDIRPMKSTFKWIFAGRDKKEKADSACLKLEELLQGEYGHTAENALKNIQKAKLITIEEALREFELYPIRFTMLFDRLCPGLRGRDDSVYGLPKELAEEVAGTPLNLKGLNCTLRRYQEWGVKYIIRQKRVLLGDEMGLGKTVQAIAVMMSLFNSGKRHFLVVAPASVLTNWCREIQKFCPVPVVKIHGAEKDKAIEKWSNEGGAAVTTYETTDFILERGNLNIDLLVVDEAHYIKNPQAQRTQNVKAICDFSDNILFMTGTAMENKVDEMISLMSMLNPEVSKKAKRIASLSNAPQFRDTISPVYYRRRREDVLKELPELIENTDWCSLTPYEEKVYEENVQKRSFADARRVSWNIDDLKYSSKAQRLLDIVEDASEDERKVIVFSFFLDTIQKVTELFGDKCVQPITGSVPPQVRQEIVDEFSSSPHKTILPAQIISGGTGLNIQSASVVVICEPQFKPSSETQAIGRAYRMGQKRTVLVHRLLCEETVDERIVDILSKKQKDFDAFADESSAAKETLELDNKTFANIMEEEAARIENKKAEQNKTACDEKTSPSEAI